MFPMAIEADHCTNRGKKVVNVSDVSNYWSRQPMVLYEMELDKCIPLCIMCHRKKNQEVCNMDEKFCKRFYEDNWSGK